MKASLAQRTVAECLGTAFLLAAVVGSGIMAARLAGGNVIEQGQTTCCYAKSEKSWIDDPAGIAWETFLTTGESTDYGDGSGERKARISKTTNDTKSCCAPEASQVITSAAHQ